tara:strand:- start:544 stop:1011 length:468 start_codon:yes stop_codon:yes gene_type:complete
MTIQDLGNLGELIAAVATAATLVYLPIQLKQNTRALRSKTLQQSSMDMSLAANAISSYGELARIVEKASDSLDVLSPEERIRFHFWMVVALRRFEAIYVQGTYVSIDQIRIEWFERSILTLISSWGPAEWWNSSKTAFSSDLEKYVDERLSTESF